MSTWKDVSNYSRDEKDRAPNTYEIVAGGHGGGRVRLVAVHRHIYYRGRWTGYVQPFDSQPTVGIDGDEPWTEEAVKAATIERARMLLRNALADLGDAPIAPTGARRVNVGDVVIGPFGVSLVESPAQVRYWTENASRVREVRPPSGEGEDVSEGRRRVLMEKAEELRSEWSRAEAESGRAGRLDKLVDEIRGRLLAGWKTQPRNDAERACRDAVGMIDRFRGK